MPVKGANKVRSRMRQVFDGIADKKAVQFVNAVGSGAGILSKTKAPQEFGNLHNSQMFDVVKNARGVKGTLSYGDKFPVKYAAILNSGIYKWRPRPPALKAGPAWNADAEPHFLEYGFESAEARQMIARYLEIFKI